MRAVEKVEFTVQSDLKKHFEDELAEIRADIERDREERERKATEVVKAVEKTFSGKENLEQNENSQLSNTLADALSQFTSALTLFTHGGPTTAQPLVRSPSSISADGR